MAMDESLDCLERSVDWACTEIRALREEMNRLRAVDRELRTAITVLLNACKIAALELAERPATQESLVKVNAAIEVAKLLGW